MRAITLATLASVSVIGIGAQLGAQLTASQQALATSVPAAGTSTASTATGSTAATPPEAPTASATA
ncbi:hypothetical protein, partial [Cryobacterium fucosi]